MSASVLAGQPTWSSAMPTLLVVLLVLVGVTLLAIGSGAASTFIRSRGATISGSLCLLGTIPASSASAGVATGVLFAAGALTCIAVAVAIAWMSMLVAVR